MGVYGSNYDYGQSPLYKDDGVASAIIVGSSSLLDDTSSQGDIKIVVENGVLALANIQMADRDLLRDPGFETAVIISLFTDRRAENEDVLPDNTDDRRGWWGDVLNEDSDKIGSRLWLTSRSKNTSEVLPLIEEYVKESLQWMVDDGAAEFIEVAALRDGIDTILINIEITRPGLAESIFYRFFFNWRAQVLGEVGEYAI